MSANDKENLIESQLQKKSSAPGFTVFCDEPEQQEQSQSQPHTDTSFNESVSTDGSELQVHIY